MHDDLNQAPTRDHLSDEELDTLIQMIRMPPERESGLWIVLLVCVAMLAMAFVGFLSGLRYYASSCAPGAPRPGSAELCSRAAQWRTP